MKQRVKNISLSILIFSGLSAFVYRNIAEAKQYHVVLSQDDWQSKISVLETAKSIMDKSTLPANVVSQWKDSLSKFEQEIVSQVQKQMADTVKSKK